MRFQVSQVMDAIEARLTTDVTGAQAVIDLGQVIQWVELDGGRPVNLIRVGMAVDALGRYLVDGGAVLYGVVEMALLSESGLTSKERMVLSRWADDGLVEATTGVGDRVAEVADLTGLPMIVLSGAEPDLTALAERFGWPDSGAGRVLRLVPRAGEAVLRPADQVPAAGAGGDADDGAGSGQVAPAVGRAKVRALEPDGDGLAPTADAAPTAPDDADADADADAGAGAETDATDAAAPDGPDDPAEESGAEENGATAEVPLPVQVFTGRNGSATAPVRVSRHRFLRVEPNGARATWLGRQWRCDGFECPAFGELRQVGQPVPRIRDGVPVCPRHGEPVADAGPRPPAYPVSVLVDDLPRRRLVVRGEEPVPVGREDRDPDVVSVAPWLHQAAANWISPVHLRLEAGEDGLIVTDVSDNGTVVWQRTGPDDPGTTRILRHESYQLGDWDSVELYTGIGLGHGDRRPASILRWQQPISVLVDAPTAAHRQLGVDRQPADQHA